MSEKAKVNSHVWLVLVCAWVSIAVTQVVTFGMGMMLPGMVKEFGIETGRLGQIMSIGTWCQVISLIPLSMLMAKVNPKISVSLVILFIATGFFVFGRATGIGMLNAGRIIYCLFTNQIATLLVGAKLRGVPPNQMTQVNGVENFVQPVGQATSFLSLGTLLVVLGSWRVVYTSAAYILAASAVIYFIVWGNGKKINYGQAETAAAAAGPKEKSNLTGALKEALSSKVVWLTSLAWPGTTLVWIAMFFFWPTYATETLGFSLPTAGVVLAMIPIFSAIASLTSPMLAKKVGYDKPFIVAWGFILPVCYYMMLVAKSVPLLCFFTALAGYGAYCFVPLAFTNVYKIGLSNPAITIATGTILTFVSVGSALAGTAIGSLIGSMGLLNALRVSCLSPLWFGILTLFLPELGRKKMEQLAKEREAK